jgi:DNA-binding NarL/FixJ family response regulator
MNRTQPLTFLASLNNQARASCRGNRGKHCLQPIIRRPRDRAPWPTLAPGLQRPAWTGSTKELLQWGPHWLRCRAAAVLLIPTIMPLEKPTILVIDDEAINIQVASEILGDDYEIIFATDGREGIELAQEAAPDILLLDVKMPGMDGYEVCAQLRADPRTAAMSIIFVTALDSTAQEIQGLEAGAIDYLTKPLTPKIVQARIRNHLEFRRKLQQAQAFAPVASADADAEGISVRQKEILEWIQAGKTNGEIASIIGSSKSNVKYHIGKIMGRLDTHNRTQLIAKAVSLRIIRLK